MSGDPKRPTRAWLLAEVARLEALNRALCRAPRGRKRGQSAMLVEIAPATIGPGLQILVADAEGDEARQLRAISQILERVHKDFAVKMKITSFDPGPDVTKSVSPSGEPKEKP